MAGSELSELSDVDAWALVRDERVDVLALLRGLEPLQWDAASLCAGWRVRDVAAHLLIDAAVEEIGRTRFAAKMAWNRFSVDRVNAWWVQRNARFPPPRSSIASSAASSPDGSPSALVPQTSCGPA